MHGDLCNGERMKDRPAKVENISFTSMANGRIQVYFLDPLRENDYEFHLFLKFFKKKQKHVKVFYILKPKISIEGLACDEKLWLQFLCFIEREKSARGFYDLIRDIPIETTNECEEILRMLQEAGKKEKDKLEVKP